MTTPELLHLSLDDVIVTRRREREDLGDIEALASSILVNGQLQPVVVDDNNELIAGFRRLSACRLNGASTILAIRKQDVTEDKAKEMELEENLARKQFTWQEEQRGLVELDRLRRKSNPNWTQVQTAVAAGGNTSQRDVSVAVQVTKMMELFPEIANAKNVSQALSMVKAKAAAIVRVQDVKNAPADYSAIEEKLVHGDSVEVIRGVDDESFHAIITDPPFGIDYEKRMAGSSTGELTGYEDSAESYRRILTMAPEMYRVLKPDGVLIWFMGISWYEEVKISFRAAGFVVDEIPLIWDRSDGRTFSTRPDRWFGRGYDIALHCIKGNPRLVQSKPNILRIPPVPSSERDLLVERPVELYAELIRRITIEGETVADFFAGSGSCPAAAESLRRNWFAVERNAERRATAIKKIKAYTPEPK